MAEPLVVVAGMSGTLKGEEIEYSNKTEGVAEPIFCDNNQLLQTTVCCSDLGSCEVFHPVEVEGVDKSVPHWRISIPQAAPLYQPQNVTRVICQERVSGHAEGSLYDRYHKEPRRFVSAPS